MRSIFIYCIPLVATLLLLSNTKHKKKNLVTEVFPLSSQKKMLPEASGRWTGTLTLTEKTEWNQECISMSTTRSVTLNFTNALPTLYRDDGLTEFDSYTDNKGTGNAEIHATGNICGQPGKSDCSVIDGVAELHNVTIRLWDSTYDVEAIAPPCGPDIMSITVSNERLTNPNVLSGSQTRTSQVPGTTATTTGTITWHLEREREPIDLIVTPDNYDTWLPLPGVDENHEGKIMSVNLKLERRDKKPLTVKAARFELQLIQTSAEPGLTINYPLKPDKPARPDMRFWVHQQAAIADDFQVLTIDCNGCSTATAKIASYDGGGYTTLIAVAVLQDSTRVRGTLMAPGGIVEIPIPKRNGTMIAEYWLKQNGNPGDYDDKDISRGNNNEGDGLTAYEEYRGVISEGVFKRLDPVKKELGITMQRSLFATFSQGLDWFKAASDVGVVKFYIHEIAADRRLNKNYSTGHIYDQYVLHLNDGFLPDNTAGKAFTKSDKPEIPANTTRVVISTANIKQNYLNWSGYAQANHLQLPWTEKEYLAQTIAHEIGHGIKIPHHGDNSTAPQNETAQQGGNPVYHIFSRNSTEISTRPYTVDSNDRVCSPNTQASGDLSCIMAYIDVCDWARIEYADGSVGLFQSPLLPIGRNFCIQKGGTGINAGIHVVGGVSYQNYFGKATNGNCLSWIQLK